MEQTTTTEPELKHYSIPFDELNRSDHRPDYARFFNPDMRSWKVTKVISDESRLVDYWTFFALLGKIPDGTERADLFARFIYLHVKIVHDRLSELTEGFSWFSVTFDGFPAQLRGAARLLNEQDDIALYCTEDESLRDAMSVVEDLMSKGVRVRMGYLKGGNLITFATPIAVNAKKGIMVLDQGRVLQPHDDAVTDVMTRPEAEDGYSCQWTNEAAGPFSRSEPDPEPRRGSCPPEGSIRISDDEAEQMWLEELAHESATS